MRTSTSTRPRCTSLVSLLFRVIALVAVAIVAVHAENDPNEPNADYFFACSGGNLETIQNLVEKDPSIIHATTRDGEHCLHLCAISGSTEIATLLLEKGADPDIRSNFDQGLRMHPLSWNTFYGRYEIIELLLKYGADVNADFDVGKKDNGEAEKGTVLDVIEQIMLGVEDVEEKVRFTKTRNVLSKNGAMRYASVEPEL